MRTAEASKELLASRDDVWAFVSEAGRLSDWWPGIFAAQDHGATWNRLYDLCQTGAEG